MAPADGDRGVYPAVGGESDYGLVAGTGGG
ncbi:hypothetical protein XIS1_1520005 [Xenorhabdus innexi]|uniref:Uncharacterized protein n=1 Tax=Xenorhabdus innexi TaxID=290109 RepID=A0A1N6MUS5_9GAMM|nr:hypothetical protein XIS1_1520005 [Xenorhabdus innexi]